MKNYDPLEEWKGKVVQHFPSLSKPQATVLAFWSFGMILAKSCALTAVTAILAPLLALSGNTLRQRLREWC